MKLPEGMEPAYTNLARIFHSPADFIIDFAQELHDPGRTFFMLNKCRQNVKKIKKPGLKRPGFVKSPIRLRSQQRRRRAMALNGQP